MLILFDMNNQYIKRLELSDLGHHDLSYTNNMTISKNNELLENSYSQEQYIPFESYSKSQDISGYYERRCYSDQFHAYPIDSNTDRDYYAESSIVSRSRDMKQFGQSSSNIYTLNSRTNVDLNNTRPSRSSSFLKYCPNSFSLYSEKKNSPEQSFEYTDNVSSYYDSSQFSEKGGRNTLEVCSDIFLKQNRNISEEKTSGDDRSTRYPRNDTYLLLPHYPKSCMIMRNMENQNSFRNQIFKNDSWRENIRGISYNMYLGQRFDNASINNRMWSLYNALTPRNELFGSNNGSRYSSSDASAVGGMPKRYPAVYPALLSRVAQAFRQRIVLGDKLKDGLTYKNAFMGSEAVDVISKIIRTMDRNLALLLGRSLDAQKFIHDVTYDHRLRDSPNEVYQFKESLTSFSNADTNVQTETNRNDVNKVLTSKTLCHGHIDNVYDSHVSLNSHSTLSCFDSTVLRNSWEMLQNDDLPNGIFTLLTECYSPTCTRDQLCYSIACPWRLEQQARLNLKPHPVLKRIESRYSLNGLDDINKEQKLWIQSVPKEVADSLDEREKRRQEIICEVIYTERDFVKDLEYLRDFWMKPLRNGNLIPEYRKEKFILAVFSNVLDVHSVNSRLAEALTKRQQQYDVIYRIGDIFLEFVPRFDPFIRYGANQLHGKYEFEKEKRENPVFSKFVEETERLKESRKLELNGYLTKPTTRLARYPLLLEAVAKSTADDNPDKDDLMKAVKLVKEFLNRVNIESGRAENRFNLMQLNKQLVFKPGECVDLKLSDENRRLIFKGILKKRNVSSTNTDSSSDIQVFLFDHVLLMVKMTKREQYKVHRKPIPLELLIISHSEDASERSSIAKKSSSSLLHGTSKSTPHKNDSSKGYAITFIHLGRRGYMITLFATTSISRKKWTEHIESQQRSLREKSCIFKRHVICEKYFLRGNKVACVVPYDGGQKLIYGTENGVYVSDRKPYSSAKATPVRVLAINGVTQVDVLEEYSILLVLADKTLYSYSMESLDLNDTTLANKRPRKIAGHTNFFKSGLCLGRLLVCVVKSSALSSTIKVLEPVDNVCRGKKQVPFKFLLQGGQDVLKVFKEFYIPTESTSVHFLKHKLCVGSPKGFEVVNLENLETQSLLDPADTSLDFVTRKENIKPIAIYRLNLKFLLCYDEMAFFVDKNGWAIKHNWMIIWEGLPTSFALFYPYLLAFEDSFIEIRHVETTALVQVILGHNIRKLHDNYRECLYAYTDDDGVDKIASLDCWESLRTQSRVSSVL